MLKRLIEVALPLKEVSEQSAREKSIRHGHISTLHIWWARRPLAACRAVVFASLIPDPDDTECPKDFRALVNDVLKENEFKPKNGEGSATKDTARNRCLEFVKHLVKWENSNNPRYIEPARKLIAAAHKFLHPIAEGGEPKVLDPFAGGGAIPLEALRLGCDSHAVDINPVAHLIQLCTLVFPQKYGQSNSRPVPEYIKRLVAHNASKKKGKSEGSLFDSNEIEQVSAIDDQFLPNVEITEGEYRKNPLAADVKYWGHWVLAKTLKQVGGFYPHDTDGRVPVGYMWVRTVKCPNPSCGISVPLIRQLFLCSNPKKRVALRMTLEQKSKDYRFEVVEGKEIDFDPEQGTMQRGQAACPACKHVANSKYLQKEGGGGRIEQKLMAVVTVQPGKAGKLYRTASEGDAQTFKAAEAAMAERQRKLSKDAVPQEPLKPWSGVFNAPLFGLTTWGSLFNARQLLVLISFLENLHQAVENVCKIHGEDYRTALACFLAIAFDRAAESNTTLTRWIPVGEKPAGIYSRQAMAMVWDYCEVNLLEASPRQFSDSLEWVSKCLSHLSLSNTAPGSVQQGSATAIPIADASVHAIATDPPYYDAVPYSDLSDFFYVWLKRSVGKLFPDLFRTLLTPKKQELVSHLGKNYPGERKTADDYESGMAVAFAEMNRVLHKDGACAVMFAHKSTAAWESIISALLHSGLTVTTSWPFHTERPGRLRAQDSAALASSVTLVCRKRPQNTGDGMWDDVRKELKAVAKERLDFFWDQGIRGADFFISAIGPALSVFGKYQRVTKLTGDEVTAGQFLDEVRSLVTNYALAKIMKTAQTTAIDPETRFYVIWKWSYGAVKVPADESFKLAQALGIGTELMWDRTGVLEKAGENVLAVPVAKRMKVKDLGEPNADGTPASLIDVLHRLCVFRDKGDTEGMTEFLVRSRQGGNPTLWLVAQAVSEILPDGDKEKQLMQGLLNQRDTLETEARKGKLF